METKNYMCHVCNERYEEWQETCDFCNSYNTIRNTDIPQAKGPTVMYKVGGDKNNYAWRDRVKEQREVGKRIGIYDGKVE